MNVSPTTCENPEYPNWMWRYNRNKHLSKFEPWFTRVERWPPHYRNMGVGDNFRFHPIGEDEQERPLWQAGLNFAADLNDCREAGSGNSALGHGPGPAPPRFLMKEVRPNTTGELLTIHSIHNRFEGCLPGGEDSVPMVESTDPINPRQYLEKTLGQRMEYPGTFPHINGLQATAASGRAAGPVCCGQSDVGTADGPLEYWLNYKKQREANILMERHRLPRPYPEYCCETEQEEPQPRCR